MILYLNYMSIQMYIHIYIYMYIYIQRDVVSEEDEKIKTVF